MADDPLYDLIWQGESGHDGYNAFNRGTHQEGKPGHRRDVLNQIGPVRHEPITNSTLDQIQARQNLPTDDATRLGAIGGYQVIGKTLKGAIQDLKLHGDAKADEPLQDKIFSEDLLKQPHAVVGYIEGKPGVTLHDAQLGLANQWTSFSDPNKPDLTSRFAGPANHASVSLAASAQALETLRTRYADAYRGAIAGHDPNPEASAWTAATSIAPEQRARWERIQGSAAKLGDTGPAVVELQGQLNRLGGAAPSAVTGTFDAGTHEAVKAFQREHGLAADGVAGPKTRLALAEATGDVLAARPAAGEAAHVSARTVAPPAASVVKPSAPVETVAAWSHGPVSQHPEGRAAAEPSAHVPQAGTASNGWHHAAERGRAAAAESVPHTAAPDHAHNPWRHLSEQGHAAAAGPTADAASHFWRNVAQRGNAHGAPVLAEGAQGAAVRTLQRGLNGAGTHDHDGHPLRVDGVFGPRTREAVSAFQEAHGIRADGVAGHDTHAALTAASASRATEAPVQKVGVGLRQ